MTKKKAPEKPVDEKKRLLATKGWTPERRRLQAERFEKVREVRNRNLAARRAAQVTNSSPPAEPVKPPESAVVAPPAFVAPPGTVAVTSGNPPPPTQGLFLQPPGPPLAPGEPGKTKEKLWVTREPSPEEFTNLTQAFSDLIKKGYAGLADLRDFEGWVHVEENEGPDDLRPTMRPYKVIIRYALKRIKFDPGLLLFALACIEIAEQEGRTAAADAKEHKARADSAKAAREAAGGGIPEGVLR